MAIKTLLQSQKDISFYITDSFYGLPKLYHKLVASSRES